MSWTDETPVGIVLVAQCEVEFRSLAPKEDLLPRKSWARDLATSDPSTWQAEIGSPERNLIV